MPATSERAGFRCLLPADGALHENHVGQADHTCSWNQPPGALQARELGGYLFLEATKVLALSHSIPAGQMTDAAYV